MWNFLILRNIIFWWESQVIYFYLSLGYTRHYDTRQQAFRFISSCCYRFLRINNYDTPNIPCFFFFSNVLTIWFKTCFEAMKAVRPFYLVFSYDFDWEKERRLGMEEEGTEWGRWRGRGRERGWERGKEREKKKNFSQVYIPKHRLKLLNVW